METEIWIGVAYVAGSVSTFFLIYNAIAHKVTDKCISKLIDDGYLKTKQNGNETEVLKWYEEDIDK